MVIKCSLLQKQLVGLKRRPEIFFFFCNFYPHWSLETVFLPLKLTRNLPTLTFFFLENWQFNHKLLPPSPPSLHTYRDWKTIPSIWKNMKERGPQKSQFPKFSVNWEKIGSTAKVNIQLSKFFNSLMNRENLRSPITETSKNSIFQSLCELGKNLEKQPLNIFEPNWESIKWIRKSYVLIKFYCWKWEVYTE